MIPARVDTATIVKAVTAAVAANTAFWVAKSAVAPKPRTLAPAWRARTELLAMAAPRQAAAEPGAWRGVAWRGVVGAHRGLCVCARCGRVFCVGGRGREERERGRAHTQTPSAHLAPPSLSPSPLSLFPSPHLSRPIHSSPDGPLPPPGGLKHGETALYQSQSVEGKSTFCFLFFVLGVGARARKKKICARTPGLSPPPPTRTRRAPRTSLLSLTLSTSPAPPAPPLSQKVTSACKKRKKSQLSIRRWGGERAGADV